MKECPFCHKKSKMIYLPSPPYIPYITKTMPYSHELCEECKEILDKNGTIEDDTNTFGIITNCVYKKDPF